MYSCGDLLFDDDHPQSEVIAQRQQLTFESMIEKAYYNPLREHERALKLVPICIHCGNQGSSDYLFGQPELERENLTGGWEREEECNSLHKEEDQPNQKEKGG